MGSSRSKGVWPLISSCVKMPYVHQSVARLDPLPVGDVVVAGVVVVVELKIRITHCPHAKLMVINTTHKRIYD